MGKKKKERSGDFPAKDRPILEGVVIRSTGYRCIVRTGSGQQFSCAIRGKFRIEGLSSTNPVAVGDHVRFWAPGESEETGLVREILPRTNHILRKAIAHSRKVHILCANVDQAILVFTIHSPLTSTGFADRFLVIAEAYHIPAILLINKIDLIQSQEDRDRLTEVRETYQSAGYPVKEVCALDPQYREVLTQILKDKVSFVGGHSGSGKSALINLVDPSLNLKTAEISSYSGKGTHTTTFSEMHPLSIGGYIIDSPGIKELGITDFEKGDLSHYFPEMAERLENCRFSNCTHSNEPGCAIIKAVGSGEIAESRYACYLRMLGDIEAEPDF